MIEKIIKIAIYLVVPAVTGNFGLKQPENVTTATTEATATATAEVAEPPSTLTCDFNSPSYECLQDLYMRAADKYDYDWKILEAVHQVETGKSGNRQVESYAGAQGPMQFMPGTFEKYGVDGNGDGKADMNNVEDAVFSAANYLTACGDGIDRQLFCYNHSNEYVSLVKYVMRSIK